MEKEKTPQENLKNEGRGQHQKDIKDIGLLTVEKEKELTQQIWDARERIKKTPEGPDRQKLIEAEEEYFSLRNEFLEKNNGLVIDTAKRYLNQVDGKMELSDLIQEGFFGLIEAAERFDPRKGYKFSTYAIPWIQQRIERAIHNKSDIVRIPVYMQEKIQKIDKAVRNIKEMDENELSKDLLSKKTGLPVKKIHRIQDVQKIQNISSLDSIVINKENSEKAIRLDDLIAAKESAPENKAIENQLKKEIEKALSGLTDREAQVIRLRYGLEDGEELTLQQIGEHLGLTRERVRQIEKDALGKLERPLNSKLKEFLE